MPYPKAESLTPRKRLEKEAIDIAMESRWQEAVERNRSILAAFPNDVDAHNRLGRALSEMGNYAEAREAYNKTLKLDPHNTIAKKNLARMAALGEGVAKAPPKAGPGRVAPEIFVGESGKVGVRALWNLAPKPVLARLSSGDEVVLKVKGKKLVGETTDGEYLGEIEPSHGLRLAKLMEGGNKYTAAISGLGDGEVKVVIKEIYQHPSQEGRPSFPARPPEGFRAYVREGLLRPESADEAEEPERDTDWEEEEEAPETLPQGFSFVGGATPEEEE